MATKKGKVFLFFELELLLEGIRRRGSCMHETVGIGVSEAGKKQTAECGMRNVE